MKTGAIIIQLLAVVLGLVGSSFAANHYICPGATGSANGTEWTDAYTGIGTAAGNINPASMVRGDTYYVANGQITPANSTTTFSTADSGSNIITIQKATDAANGTSTGWTNGGTGACNSSQAVFGPLQFTSDYWTFNGVHRGNGTGNPWLDWRTNYGFFVNNNNGSSVPVNAQGAVLVGITGSNQPQSDVRITYTQVNGSADVTGAYQDMGIQVSGGESTNNYLGYNYVLNVGVGDAIDCDSCSNFIEEYNWVQNNEYWQGSNPKHSEILAIRCWNNGVNNGITIRFNFVENSNSTAMIATPCVNDIQPSNWAIYGNVLLYNGSEVQPGLDCVKGGTVCGNGDGWMSLWNFATWTGYLYVFNNTISYIDLPTNANQSGPAGACHHDWGGASGVTMGNVAFYNNLYYHCVENITPISCPGSCASYIDDYNSYFDMSETNDHGAHAQVVSSTDPFVNVGQSANQNDFALTGTSDPTSAWFNTSSLVAGNSTDMMGNARTSSRGALQFMSTSDPPPNPPSGLEAVVQ
jgi:hypothetical protein